MAQLPSFSIQGRGRNSTPPPPLLFPLPLFFPWSYFSKDSALASWIRKSPPCPQAPEDFGAEGLLPDPRGPPDGVGKGHQVGLSQAGDAVAPRQDPGPERVHTRVGGDLFRRSPPPEMPPSWVFVHQSVPFISGCNKLDSVHSNGKRYVWVLVSRSFQNFEDLT